MKFSFLLQFVPFFLVSSCSASKQPFIQKKETGGEQVKTLEEGIASIGSDIASCIGELKPLECLASVIQRAFLRCDPIISRLLNQPALLSESKDHCQVCHQQISLVSTKSIAEWLIDLSKKPSDSSFYSLFSITNLTNVSPLISFSEMSFELMTIIDVVGLKIRMNSSLTKYMGIAHAILHFVNFPRWVRQGPPRLQIEHVDPIVAYLGDDCGHFETNAILDKVFENDVIPSAVWEQLIWDFLEVVYMRTRCPVDVPIISLSHAFHRANQVQLRSIAKGIINCYPIAHWQTTTLEYWPYEKVIAVPNLIKHLKGKDKELTDQKEISPVLVDSTTENTTYASSNCKCTTLGLSFPYIAKILYPTQLNIEDFMEFLSLVHLPIPSFNLEIHSSRDILLYSSLFYALPGWDKQDWLWGFLERAHLLEVKEDKVIEEVELKSTTTILRSVSRTKMYQQVAKACQQEPDLTLSSFLTLIDEGHIEVISNIVHRDTPLLNMIWAFDDKKKEVILRLVSSSSSSFKDVCSSPYNDKKEDLSRSSGDSDDSAILEEVESLKTSQSGNILSSSKKVTKEYKSKLITKRTSLAIRPRANVRYEVFILRDKSIIDISAIVRRVIFHWNERKTEDLRLQSGDLILISHRLSRPRLEEIANLYYPKIQAKDNGLLVYMLLTTGTIAIHVL